MTLKISPVVAQQNARAAKALADSPGAIAASIERAPGRLSLAIALADLFDAPRREDVRRAAGRFSGLVQGVWVATTPDDARKWSAAEWEALIDYGNEMEARALLALED